MDGWMDGGQILAPPEFAEAGSDISIAPNQGWAVRGGLAEEGCVQRR